MIQTTDSPRRLEGRDKVTGIARYTNDFGPALTGGFPLLHGCIVQSQKAGGRIISVDTAEALLAPGVQSVVTHRNAPRLERVKTLVNSELDNLLPLQSDELHYRGEAIALVLADTLERAQHAACLLQIVYSSDAPAPVGWRQQTPSDTKRAGMGRATQGRGHPDREFAVAPVQIDATYDTEPAHHNSIEPAAAIARWDRDGGVTMWISTQFVFGEATTLGQAFHLGGRESKLRLLPLGAFGVDLGGRVRVITPLVGGAFGGKLSQPLLLLAALGARVAGAPVKIALTRRQSFSLASYRSGMQQRIRLGASPDGQLRACLHDSVVQTSHVGSFVEPAGEWSHWLYRCPHVRTTHRVVCLPVNAPGFMRAPGAAPGSFAAESAMDELALQLGLDPIELRLRNYAETDPQSNKPWSSKTLRECYRLGAERIGWNLRAERSANRKQHAPLIGYGMATAAHRNVQFPAVARIELTPAGDAVVASAAHEFGQGAITALTQIAADALGFPRERVRFEWGDTRLPFAFLGAGSATTLSIGSAIEQAAGKLKRTLIQCAVSDKQSPLRGLPARQIVLRDGCLAAIAGASQKDSVADLLARHPHRRFSAQAVAGRTFGYSRYARAAFGAQFAEVAVDPETGRVRVTRLVGAFAAGRIINPLLAQSQLRGAMLWGLGQALLEETFLENGSCAWVNANLAEALIPAHSDVPPVEVLLVEEDDSRAGRLGVKGLGEIGITGVAAAIANAIYNATGKRIRRLPIKLDSLL